LNESDWESIGNDSKRLRSEYPFDEPKWNDTNTDDYDKESFVEAEGFVYNDVRENKELQAAYVDAGRKIAEK